MVGVWDDQIALYARLHMSGMCRVKQVFGQRGQCSCGAVVGLLWGCVIRSEVFVGGLETRKK